MKKFSIVLMTILVSSFFAFKAIEHNDWVIDKSHAKLSFSVSHLMVSDVDGWFKNFDATITAEKSDFSDAVVTMTADVNSIDTDNSMRDKDLKSVSYFDAEKFPRMTFKSKTFLKVDDMNYKVTGELRIHGITKTVELNALCRMATNPMTKKEVAGFKITGTIKRLDFEIGKGATTTLVGDDVAIVANVEFGKK
jgi:polyisoprenoid-binding protein YceI